MSMAGNQVDITQLPIHQLQSLRQDMEAELGVLTESFSQLKKAQIKFSAGLESLQPFVDENEGEMVMIPLTNTLYVPGQLSDTKKVIVDVGTGYFVEKSIPDAKDFYQRKIDFLRQNLDKLSTTVEQKQGQHRLLIDVIQYKFATIQQEQAKKTTQ